MKLYLHQAGIDSIHLILANIEKSKFLSVENCFNVLIANSEYNPNR